MKKTFFICFASLVPLCIATLAHAQGYTPIVGLPGVDSDALSTEGYVTALYRLAITVACLLALYKIIFGGVKWALSDVVTDKGEAKKDIKGALLGLLIVLSAVLVLNTINPNLTQLNIFGEGAPSIDAIEAARGETAPVTYGSAVNSANFSPAQIAKFAEDCKTINGVTTRTETATGRTGGTQTLTRCYANPEIIDAKPGDVLDVSKYPPNLGDMAVQNFKNSCNGPDEFYSDSYGTDDVCQKKVIIPTESVKIGSTIDLSKVEATQVNEALDVFTKNCESTRVNGVVVFADGVGNNVFACEAK